MHIYNNRHAPTTSTFRLQFCQDTSMLQAEKHLALLGSSSMENITRCRPNLVSQHINRRGPRMLLGIWTAHAGCYWPASSAASVQANDCIAVVMHMRRSPLSHAPCRTLIGSAIRKWPSQPSSKARGPVFTDIPFLGGFADMKLQ